MNLDRFRERMEELYNQWLAVMCQWEQTGWQAEEAFRSYDTLAVELRETREMILSEIKRLRGELKEYMNKDRVSFLQRLLRFLR